MLFSGLFHRMILAELFKVFILSLVALTGVLLLAGIFQEASKNGLGPTQIIMVIPLLIPSMLPYTLPATTLFATCVVYGRLAHDNEILAIRAAGINILRVVWPGILLGLAISAVTMYLYYRPIPRTHYLLRVKFLKDVEEFLYAMLKHEGRVVHAKLPIEIYVKRVEGRRLLDANFIRRDPATRKIDMMVRAREATLSVNLAQHQLRLQTHNCVVIGTNDDTGSFVERDFYIDLPPDFSNPGRTRPNDMSWQEMRAERERMKKEREAMQIEKVAHEAVLAFKTAPPNFAKHVKDLTNKIKQKDQEIRDIAVEMQMRPALAMGCLCFVLVGCPVGIWFSRSDYLSAFIICFLPIVLIYYPLMLCGINLGRTAHMAPAFPIWAADALMGMASLGLYRRLLKN